MHHVIELGISFDDEAIKKKLKEEGYNTIINQIKNDVEKQFYGVYGNLKAPGSLARTMLEEAINNVVNEKKDIIVENVIKLLTEKIYKSRKVQQEINKMMENIEKE